MLGDKVRAEINRRKFTKETILEVFGVNKCEGDSTLEMCRFTDKTIRALVGVDWGDEYVITTHGQVVPKKYLVPRDRVIVDGEATEETGQNRLAQIER